MGRFARIVLVVVALALVFAPRALASTAHDGPRLLTAAVLAPATGDSDALTPARERETSPTLVVLALLVVALALVPPTPPGHRVAAELRHHAAGPDDPRPRRRGPPLPFA